MLFVIATIAGAQSSVSVELPPEIEEKINSHAVLENLETGEKIALVPYLVDYQEALTASDYTEITYEVGIPHHMLGISSSPINERSFLLPNLVHATENKNKCDSTSSVCASLTLYYHDGEQNGYDWMYSDKVMNTWTRLDPQVSWSSGKIRAICNAPWFDRGGQCNTSHLGTVSNPISGTDYTITPWFTGSGNKTHVNDISYQLASQKITLHRGGSNWNFEFCVGNGGGNLINCY